MADTLTTLQNPLLKLARPGERTFAFIDGANLYSTSKNLQVDLDYKKLRAEFEKMGRFIRANYYTALIDEEEYSPVRPLVDWLDYNGFNVVTKPAKQYYDVELQRRRYKGNMDAEMVVDLLEAVPYMDHAILFSGDGDFYAPLDALRRKGIRTTVVSTMKTDPPAVADDLRRVADHFVDIVDMLPVIERKDAPRRRERIDERAD